jgi:serpin B
MKQNKIFFGIILIIVTALFLVSCIPATPDSNPISIDPALDTNGSTPIGVSAIGSSNNKFAIDVYKLLSKGNNMFFSPTSISTALAMAAEGAKGATYNEMLKVLYLPMNRTERLANIAGLLSSINSKDKNYTLDTANALWVNENYKLLADYTNAIKNYFGGNAVNVNFNNPEDSSKIINSWVEEKTRNRIKDLVPPSAINADTRLIITNAIYFKGKWLESFNKDNTKDSDFWITPKESIKAKMMRSDNLYLKYFSDNSFEAVELPYQGNELSMLILLPRDGSLENLRANLSSEMLEEIKSKMFQTEVIVEMPKFKMETDYNLSWNG